MKKISVITPVYNEEENLADFINAFEKIIMLKNKTNKIELIFIDDGSGDNSWEKILQLSKIKSYIKAIRLSRNMGSHVAISAGFHYATGDAVCTLACDLQDDPETINQFIKEWKNGYEVVWGTRNSRDDDGWKVIASKMFESLLRKWAMPKNSLFSTGSFLLVDRRVRNYFNQFSEHNRITFAIIAHMGYKQTRVYYDRKQRQKGTSGWNIGKMFRTLYDALIAFSYIPIRINTFLSLAVTACTVPLGIYFLYLYFTGRTGNIGYISIVLIIMIFGSVLLINTAMILEYLTRVYSNTTNRPLYFISDIKGFNEKT